MAYVWHPSNRMSMKSEGIKTAARSRLKTRDASSTKLDPPSVPIELPEDPGKVPEFSGPFPAYAPFIASAGNETNSVTGLTKEEISRQSAGVQQHRKTNQQPTPKGVESDREVEEASSFGDNAHVLRLEQQIADLKEHFRTAKLPAEKQLRYYAQIRAAARMCRVSHVTIHNAIKDHRLKSYKIFGGIEVVDTRECKMLWKNGATLGRPPLE